VSLAGALALAEGALRLAFPAEKRHYVWSPGLTRNLRTDPVQVPGPPRNARFTVNTQGIRGPELGANEHRILAIGGSTTECLYIDDAETWPARVQRALPRTADGRAVWIGNVGKSGRYSRDHVLQLKHLSAELPRIDTALVLVGINDVTVALREGDHYAMPAPITEPEAERQQMHRAFAITPGALGEAATDELGPEHMRAWQRTALFQLVRRVGSAVKSRVSARGLLQDDQGQMAVRWREHRRHASAILTEGPDLSAPLAEYRRNLSALADLAAARGIRLVLMTQPTLWRADLSPGDQALLWMGGLGDFQSEAGKAYYAVPVLAETMRRYNEVVLEVCHERRLPCLDLATRIPKETTMFIDDVHFTDAGLRAVAAEVARHLRRMPPFVSDAPPHSAVLGP
jgi:lysophospholipase L1-like esterase